MVKGQKHKMTKWVGQDHMFSKTRGNSVEGDTTKGINTTIPTFYHHLFTEHVHLYNFPLYWVCWGHKRFLVFGCRVV